MKKEDARRRADETKKSINKSSVLPTNPLKSKVESKLESKSESKDADRK